MARAAQTASGKTVTGPRPHRGRYVAKLRTPPDSWHPDWLLRMDQRFRHLAVVRARLATLESDLSAGEAERLSFAQRRLANHAVWADTMLEELERRFARGDEIDFMAFATVLNTLNRVLRTLGIQRRAKELPSLAEVLQIRAPEA
jgi:hypothetical protein